jgi:hypothetical protein
MGGFTAHIAQPYYSLAFVCKKEAIESMENAKKGGRAPFGKVRLGEAQITT